MITNVHYWLSKAMLDAYVRGESPTQFSSYSHRPGTRIGAGALDYDFGALEDADNKLTKSYENLACGLPLPTRIVCDGFIS